MSINCGPDHNNPALPLPGTKKRPFCPQIRPRPTPASIELRASLRYTGTQLRLGDEAFRGAAPRIPCRSGFISNISKA